MHNVRGSVAEWLRPASLIPALSLISHASSGKQPTFSLPQFLYSLNGMVWNGMLSRVRLFAIPWTVALQAPLSR